MFTTLSDRVDLSGLELSAQPAEREAQVRVLKDVFSVLERHHLERRTPDWSFLAEVCETPAIAAAVDRCIRSGRQ